MRRSAGRKSSLGRRSTLVKTTSASSGLDSSSKGPEKKSMLLMPGFASNVRPSTVRASSEDRLSGVGTSRMSTYSAARSKSHQSLDCMTPTTPMNYLRNPPMAGSRPSRAHLTSSMESGRLSSIGGGMRSTRKERRPINDKDFQTAALKKVQDYFQMQMNARDIMDNSMSVRPMTTKKFVNMVDYLMRQINPEGPVLTKDNFVDEIVKNMKILGYCGKLEKSWLITVNAQHSWQYVIALLVWLVDVVNVASLVAGNMNMLYPDSLGEPSIDDECNEPGADNMDKEVDNVLHDNWKLVLPYLSAVYQNYLEGDPEYEAKQDAKSDQLINRIMEKMNITDAANAALEVEVNELKRVWNDPELIARENELKNKITHLENLKADVESLVDYIRKTQNYIMGRNQDIESLQLETNALAKKRDETKVRVASMREECDALKVAKCESDRDRKERREIDEFIEINEKCIAELKKSIYSLDIKLLKTKKKLEEPLVQFNQLIAENIKDEPQLQLCTMTNIINDESRTTDLVDNIKAVLTSIRDNWQQQVHAITTQLKQYQANIATSEEHRSRLAEKVEIKQKNLDDLNQEMSRFMEHKDKEATRYKNEIAQLAQNLQQTLDNMPVVDENEKVKLIEKDRNQKEDIKALIAAANYAFQRTKAIYENYFKEAENCVRTALQSVDDLIQEKETESVST